MKLQEEELSASHMSVRYLAWDRDILNAPLHFLNDNITLPNNPILPGFPNPSLAVLADTAIRGAATVTAVIDVEAGMLLRLKSR